MKCLNYYIAEQQARVIHVGGERGKNGEGENELDFLSAQTQPLGTMDASGADFISVFARDQLDPAGCTRSMKELGCGRQPLQAGHILVWIV